MSAKPLIAVVGLGPAGCTAAHFLAASTAPSVRVHLIGEDFGGMSTTEFVDGTPIDSAATMVTGIYTLVNQLVDSLGLASERQPFIPRTELRHDSGNTGTFTLNDPGSLFFYSLLGVEDKLRLAVELVQVLAETSMPGFDPMALSSMQSLDTGLSAAEFVKTRISPQVLDNMARALESLWLTPLEQMSEAHLKAWLARPMTPYSVFARGTQRIWSTMVERLKADPEHQVTSGARLQRVTTLGTGYELALHHADGRAELLHVDGLILALPSPEVLSVASGVLSAQQRDVLEAQDWLPSIHGAYQVRALRDIPPSHGLVFPAGPATHPIAAACVINHHKLAGASGPQGAAKNDVDIVSIYASGAYSQTLAPKSDAVIFKELYASAQHHLGGACYWLEGPPESELFLFRRKYAIPTPAVGSANAYLYLQRSQRGQRLQLAGGWTQLPVPYTLESSARSGQRAAHRLLRAV